MSEKWVDLYIQEIEQKISRLKAENRPVYLKILIDRNHWLEQGPLKYELRRRSYRVFGNIIDPHTNESGFFICLSS